MLHFAGAVSVAAGWGEALGYSVAHRRAEAFNTLVFSEIGYSITTRFIKASTFHPRVLKGNPWCVPPTCCQGYLRTRGGTSNTQACSVAHALGARQSVRAGMQLML
jgi:hypothetical protein